jgi:hypothetical protein
MSRELDAMQFVLDLLTDGIITSAVQQIGFTPHDKITEPELPFVQVYSPIDENQEQTKRQPPGVLTLQLDILDVFGNSNVLREAIASLDASFRIDNTMHGLAESSFITLRSVAERKNDERSVVGAVITVQIAEGYPDPGHTSIVTFDDEVIWFKSSGILLENSRYIGGVLGVKKDQTELLSIVSTNTAIGMPGFPMDLSVTNRLRLLAYFNSNNALGWNLQIRLQSTINVNNSTFSTNSLSGHGWVFPSFDLTDPVSETGTGADLSAIEQIDIIVNWGFFFQEFVSPDYGILFADLGYSKRDTGLNNSRGYDPGF